MATSCGMLCSTGLFGVVARLLYASKVEHYSFHQFPIMLPIMLTDFTYCSHNYAWFNTHSIQTAYNILLTRGD